MQSKTTRPEWFQTVPFVQAIDTNFDVVEYFGDFEIDNDAKEDIAAITKISASIKIGALLKNGAILPTLQEIAEYKELIADLSRYSLLDNGMAGEDLNDNIDEIDTNGCGVFWERLGTYKGFQIFENIECGHILVSQADGPCFKTRDGWGRFCEIDSCDREAVAIADAQEFIDCLVLSPRNDDPEHDWNVLGRRQLGLPL